MYLEEVEQPVEMITQVNKQLLMWLKRLWDLKKKKKTLLVLLKTVTEALFS